MTKRKLVVIFMSACAVFAIVSTIGMTMLKRSCNDMRKEVDALKHEVTILQDEVITLRLKMILKEEEEEKPDEIPELNYDYDYVLRVVAAECAYEPFEGKLAVAQTIRETAEKKGITPEEVVRTPNQYASPASMEIVNDEVREACKMVLMDGESITDEPIQYFYSTRGGFVSAWHENSLEYVFTIGYHKFFKEK